MSKDFSPALPWKLCPGAGDYNKIEDAKGRIVVIVSLALSFSEIDNTVEFIIRAVNSYPSESKPPNP